jgi:hypothetical protein
MVLRSFCLVNITFIFTSYLAFTKIRNIVSNRCKYEWTEWCFEHFLDWVLIALPDLLKLLEHLMNVPENVFKEHRDTLVRFYHNQRDGGGTWATFEDFRTMIFNYRPLLLYLRKVVPTTWAQSCRRGLYDWRFFIYQKCVEGFPVRPEHRRRLLFPPEWIGTDYTEFRNGEYFFYTEHLSVWITKEFYRELFSFGYLLIDDILALGPQCPLPLELRFFKRGSGVLHAMKEQLLQIDEEGWMHKDEKQNPVYPHHLNGYTAQFHFDPTARLQLDYAHPNVLFVPDAVMDMIYNQEKEVMSFRTEPETMDCKKRMSYGYKLKPDVKYLQDLQASCGRLPYDQTLMQGAYYPPYAKPKIFVSNPMPDSRFDKEEEDDEEPQEEDHEEPQSKKRRKSKHRKTYSLAVPPSYSLLSDWRAEFEKIAKRAACKRKM